MERDEIIIRNAIVHILDSTIGMPVLSDHFLDLGPDLNEFLRSHIYKIVSSDDMKSCIFNKEESFVYQCLENFNEESMVTVSQEIPMDQYNDKNNVEFITNPDGTIWVLIKNINRIISK